MSSKRVFVVGAAPGVGWVKVSREALENTSSGGGSADGGRGRNGRGEGRNDSCLQVSGVCVYVRARSEEPGGHRAGNEGVGREPGDRDGEREGRGGARETVDKKVPREEA